MKLSRFRATLAISAVLLLAAAALAAPREKVLHAFRDRPAAYPYSRLVADAAGNFYGTTTSDGVHGAGTIYELSPLQNGGWAYHVLYVFPGTDGNNPHGRLLLDAAGNLYGTTNTFSTGNYGCGTAYELTPRSSGRWVFKMLAKLDCWAGLGLAMDAQGNLYGRTYSGGSSGCGTVFELTPGSNGQWTETILYNFSFANRECGIGTGLIFDPTGNNLYGADDNEVFVLNRGSGGKWIETTAHRFSGKDGYEASGDLIFDGTGNLYGANAAGGRGGEGTVYRLTPQPGEGWTSTVLHTFPTNDQDGYYPFGGVTLDSAGNLYGTTSQGGVYGFGVVFKLSSGAGTWHESLLHSFTGGRDGGGPFGGGLILDTSGNLYGTTTNGGIGQGRAGYGVVFQMVP
jgi:uncharacterized repeat protein (TIGR03803 family)